MAKADTDRWYWQRGTDEHGRWKLERGQPYRPPGEELAALRRGTGREAGTVAEMWPFYVSLVSDHDLARRDDAAQVPIALQAEHIALTLFGLHQQSQSQPMHERGSGVGDAVLALRQSGRFSEDAVDRRFAQTATATSLAEVARHLRGLISQLRTLASTPALDYSRLIEDLEAWHRPHAQQQVRRRWGGQYHRWAKQRNVAEESPDAAPAVN